MKPNPTCTVEDLLMPRLMQIAQEEGFTREIVCDFAGLRLGSRRFDFDEMRILFDQDKYEQIEGRFRALLSKP